MARAIHKGSKHMEQSAQAAKAETQTAATESQASKGSGDTAEVEKLRKEIDAEKAARQKAESDRDNYREGLLRAKGKRKPELDLSDPEKVIEAVRETTKEEILEERAKKESENLSLERAKQQERIAELERALRAKEASTSIAGGVSAGAANMQNSEVKDPNAYWTKEQKDYLRSVKGFTDDMIARAEKLAREQSASQEHGSTVAPRKY
jgi:hypothetical protein